MPLPHTLTYREIGDDPPTFRISYDGVEIGTVSERGGVVHWQWTWRVDPMPLMANGGDVPAGDAETFQHALTRFKDAFTTWMDGLHPGDWQRNRDHKRAAAERGNR